MTTRLYSRDTLSQTSSSSAVLSRGLSGSGGQAVRYRGGLTISEAQSGRRRGGQRGQTHSRKQSPNPSRVLGRRMPRSGGSAPGSWSTSCGHRNGLHAPSGLGTVLPMPVTKGLTRELMVKTRKELRKTAGVLAQKAGFSATGMTLAEVVTRLNGRSFTRPEANCWLGDRTPLAPGDHLPKNRPIPPLPVWTFPTIGLAPDFYNSKAWRDVRYQVMKRSRGRCDLCGRSSREAPLHVDHIKPRSLVPSRALDPTNLQVLCKDCNLGKSNTDETDWRTP